MRRRKDSKRNPSTESTFDSLVNWYVQHARRLPWRLSREPYRIMVSEFMLQQTQVSKVIPYYDRFLERFPTVRDLAEAPEEEVLSLWSGLGYYRRAANLKKCAEAICHDYGGQFPDELDQVRTLPGVGDYTAGAILSIAFDQPHPAIDGNVKRVISRIVGKVMGGEEIAEFLQPALYRNPPHMLNQALMDLGATICVPRNPSCSVCPIQKNCVADRTGDFPQQHKNRTESPTNTKKFYQVFYCLQAGKKFFLVKRDEDSFLKGLWEFPSLLSDHPLTLQRRREGIVNLVGKEWGIRSQLCSFRHAITYRRFFCDALLCVWRSSSNPKTSKLMSEKKNSWFSLEEMETLPLTGATKKIVAHQQTDPSLRSG